MMLKNEPSGSEPHQSPALAVAMVVATVATLVLGLYPQPLFEFAEASARTLGRRAGQPSDAVKAPQRAMKRAPGAFSRSAGEKAPGHFPANSGRKTPGCAGEVFHKVCYSQHA
jgi:hypothetical protein